MISRTLVAMMFFLSGVSLAQAQHHFHVIGNSTCSTAHGLHCGTCNISCPIGQSAVCIPGKEGCPPGATHGGSCWCLENPQCYCR